MRIEWDDSLALGVDFIDRDHAEAVALLGEAADCSDEGIPALMDRVVAHLEAHFARENEAMDRSGFFAREVHQREHERFLEEARGLQAQAGEGQCDAVRVWLTESLPRWLLGHLGTMDRATARWLQEREADTAGSG